MPKPDKATPHAIPKIRGPAVQGPFDPPVSLEGPNHGLTESLAEFLWLRFGGEGLLTLKESVHPLEADGWRRVALDVINFMVGRGFRGPGGLRPDPGQNSWDYAWFYDSEQWEIVDGQGGGVALVCNHDDVPLILAAPAMAAAIRDALDHFRQKGGVTRADLRKLEESTEGVPDVRSKD